MGLEIGRLLDAAQMMVRSCAAAVPPADNPGVVLGTVLGVLAKQIGLGTRTRAPT